MQTPIARHALVTVAVATALAALAPTRAQELADGAQRAGEPSWGDYTSPERRRGRQLRRQGLLKLLDAQQSSPDSLGPPPDVLFDQALVRFERALRDLPGDADLLYFRAVALAGWEREVDGREERRTEEAIQAFEELRRVAPEYHADRVAFELAILRSRAGDHRGAVDEYRRALAAATLRPVPPPHALLDRERMLASLFDPVSMATVHLNLAENLMLLGELDAAIASYRRAVERTREDPLGRVLALWGLALALDRGGDHAEAMVTARRAIQLDPFAVPQPALDARFGIDRAAHGPMAILHSRLVFFEPAYELHAYDAIGWEALAGSAERERLGGASRQELLRRARLSWASYLTAGGNEAPHGEHARRAAPRRGARSAAR